MSLCSLTGQNGTNTKQKIWMQLNQVDSTGKNNMGCYNEFGYFKANLKETNMFLYPVLYKKTLGIIDFILEIHLYKVMNYFQSFQCLTKQQN
jgi:hypothetical protein